MNQECIVKVNQSNFYATVVIVGPDSSLHSYCQNQCQLFLREVGGKIRHLEVIDKDECDGEAEEGIPLVHTLKGTEAV